ncbi:hypothetical protein [Bacillus pseudomycoides]|uniref:hypothetical protein n=1 Tax=Bacillus pseudomycoides TaxID=64104 RepID=UPI001FB42291|nr:hypothetical protein [Bacillus pseudomycoides]
MTQKKIINFLYYTIIFLFATSYIWVLVIEAYMVGIPQYSEIIYGILLLTAFTFPITVPVFYIGLPLLFISAVLACFRSFSITRMLTYYVRSCFFLFVALYIPLQIYSHYEGKYIFTEQVKDQKIIEKVKHVVEKNNVSIQITDVKKQSMLEWNEGLGSPDYPKLEIEFELLDCNKQKDQQISGYSCTTSIEAYYNNNKWLVDFNSKENKVAMNLSINNQKAEEEENIRKNAESKAIQLLKEEYNLNLSITKQTFRKNISSNKKENTPAHAVHEITVNGYLNEDTEKHVTVRVEYDPITKVYWPHMYAHEMSDRAQNEIKVMKGAAS